MIISGVSAFLNDLNQLTFFTTLLIIVFVYKRMYLDLEFILIVLLWILINFLSVFFINYGQEGSMVTVFTRAMKFAIVYFILKIVGVKFFEKLNSYLFILVIISLIIFPLQVINLSMMRSLAKLFGPLTHPDFLQHGNWYGFIYVFSNWQPYRNCGFMWEPGAFAGMLILLMAYRLAITNFKIDKYIYVYFIALLTTLSTAGYLAFSMILVAFFIINGRKYAYIIILLPVIIYGGYELFMSSDFLHGKINRYLELGTEAWGENKDGSLRTSRLGFFLIVLDESFHWPFGHGVIRYPNHLIQTYGKIYGPGLLSSILLQWGWIGLIAIFTYIFKFFRAHSTSLISLLFTVSLGIILFSNPDSFYNVVFSIIFYSIITRKSGEVSQEYVPLSRHNFSHVNN